MSPAGLTRAWAPMPLGVGGLTSPQTCTPGQWSAASSDPRAQAPSSLFWQPLCSALGRGFVVTHACPLASGDWTVCVHIWVGSTWSWSFWTGGCVYIWVFSTWLLWIGLCPPQEGRGQHVVSLDRACVPLKR